MDSVLEIEVTDHTPLLLGRVKEKPAVAHPNASHFSVVTTPGNQPEMHDQMEDQFR